MKDRGVFFSVKILGVQPATSSGMRKTREASWRVMESALVFLHGVWGLFRRLSPLHFIVFVIAIKIPFSEVNVYLSSDSLGIL